MWLATCLLCKAYELVFLFHCLIISLSAYGILNLQEYAIDSNFLECGMPGEPLK